MPIVLFILFGIVVVIFAIWQYQQSSSYVQDWASKNGYQIVASERRMLLRGPYFLTSKGQDVYYIKVIDVSGKRRSGYLRVGGYMAGMLSNQVDVRWDAETPEAQ